MCNSFSIASQIILCLLLAALLGAIIGYLLGKMACKKDKKEEESHGVVPTPAPKTNEASSTEEDRPETLSAPRDGTKDNLTKIKGIGFKIEQILNDQGIYHFDQIAKWNEKNIAWVDDNVAFPGRVKREQWVPQAAKLAAGEETEFSKRVESGEVSTSKKG
jgi:NADH-quinone oxidoreductase subunit E